MSIFFLVDCNNFFVSCERVFNPYLEKKPVVVLSNNDGCIISRSNEAKKLGILMGAPFFQWRHLCEQQKLIAFSPNFVLYGDISNRIMTTLHDFGSNMEIYSIDEAFLYFDSFKENDLSSYAELIKETVKQWTGVPVSIGIGPTKTLAKIANYVAKKYTGENIFDLSNQELREKVLSAFPVNEIWGIGRNLTQKLKDLNIHTAKALRDMDTQLIRSKFGVVVERIVLELRGISCLFIEAIQPKKQIMVSRSFGRSVTTLDELEEAASHYVAKACIKLRLQKSLASGMIVFLHTQNFIKNDIPYSNTTTCYFNEASDDSTLIISTAKRCLSTIYRKNCHYKKVGVILFDLVSENNKQTCLFSTPRKTQGVMKVLDAINRKIGNDKLFICAEGVERSWWSKSERRSPNYTSRWKELIIAYCK